MKRVPLYPSIHSGPTLTQQTGQQNVVYYNVNQNGRVRFGQISPGSNIPNNVLPLKGTCHSFMKDSHKCEIHSAYQAGRFPLFWLPYMQNQNYRVTLVDYRSAAVAAASGGPASFFLTDCVDGCSVYVEGTRHAPTVYHMNAAAVKFHPLDGSAPFGTTGDYKKDSMAFATKTADMNQRFQSIPAGPTAVGSPGAKYVQNDDYMIRDPKASKQVLKQLKKNAKDVDIPQRVDKIEFVTQGTVFGVRDTGGDWTFYYQKRVSAIYYHNRNRYKPFVKSDYVAIGHRMYPHDVQEFWPEGAGHVIMRH